MNCRIRQAELNDLEEVSGVLREAAQWLEHKGMALWLDSELSPERMREEVGAGLFYVAEDDDEIAGVIRFQLEDPEFWPDAAPDEAAYIHRLAVRRRYAGGQVSLQLLDWALEKTRLLGRNWLRMDTETHRTRLREIYEKYGFQYHSDKQVGPYRVTRYEYPINQGAT